jgi:Zn-dependent peptidase ImmA (M78 family)
MKPARRIHIDRAADAERARAAEAIPVPVEGIITAAEVALARNHHDSLVSSMAIWDRGQRIVGMNTGTSLRRVRFAAAHAYGHLVLHEHRRMTICHQIGLDQEPSPADATPGEETEATWFAGTLLMPADTLRAELVREYALGHESKDALIDALCRTFEVSPEAMGWRLISLSLASG